MGVYISDKDGKLKKVAGNFILKESPNLGCLRTEVVYDMTSPDSNKNWGYKTGIASSTTISNKDFNKYQALIIYSNRASDDYGSTMTFVPLDKAQDNGTYVGQSVVYLARLASANSLLANTLITTINSAKTSITITFKQQYNTTHYEEASYRTYKIEGVIKTPAMIYTGKELHEGNGVSIKDGVVSSKGFDLVWTNNNVSGGFAGQTLSLDLSKYNEVVVYCTARNTDEAINLSAVLPVGNTNGAHMRIAFWDTNLSKVRQVARWILSTSKTNIVFSNGFFDGATEASLFACIPKYIYAR